jgi:hypothetical protein
LKSWSMSWELQFLLFLQDFVCLFLAVRIFVDQAGLKLNMWLCPICIILTSDYLGPLTIDDLLGTWDAIFNQLLILTRTLNPIKTLLLPLYLNLLLYVCNFGLTLNPNCFDGTYCSPKSDPYPEPKPKSGTTP